MDQIWRRSSLALIMSKYSWSISPGSSFSTRAFFSLIRSPPSILSASACSLIAFSFLSCDPERMLCQGRLDPEPRQECVRQFLQWMRYDAGGLSPEGFLFLGRSLISYRQRSPLFLIYYTRCASYSFRPNSRSLFSFSSYNTFYKLSLFLSSTIGMKFSRTCCENCRILSAFILLQSYLGSLSPWAIFLQVGLLQETRYSSLALLIRRYRSRIDSFSFNTSMKVFQWSDISASEIGRCRLRISANFFLRYSRMDACLSVKDYQSFSWRDF